MVTPAGSIQLARSVANSAHCCRDRDFRLALYHRNISAKRATLEFVTNAELGNPAWIEGRKLFGELTGKWTHSLDKNLDRTKDIDSAALVLYLNYCELVAVAIQEKAKH